MSKDEMQSNEQSETDNQPVTRTEFRTHMDRIDARFDGLERRFDERIEEKFDEFKNIVATKPWVEEKLEGFKSDLATKPWVEETLKGFKSDLATKPWVEEKFQESKRHMGVLYEDLCHKLDIVIEGMSPLIAKSSNHDVRLDRVEADVALLKLAVASRK